jgi:hypothetical protein
VVEWLSVHHDRETEKKKTHVTAESWYNIKISLPTDNEQILLRIDLHSAELD